MTKTIATLAGAALLLSANSALAEGYQVNTLSASQNGMGHTGTAMHLGAESMIFNPAGVGFLDKQIEFSGSFTAVMATAEATLPGGEKYTTDNTPSTPLAFNLGMSVYDNFKVGLSFYTPYGSGINWGEDWPGAVLNQSVTLKAFTVQPTLAWRPIKSLSIGAGAMITWGTVDQSKGLVPTSTYNAILSAAAGVPVQTDATPASIQLKGEAAVTAGVHVGVMWDITDKWTVGASFRQKMGLKVKCGTAAVRYSDETAQGILQGTLNILNEANFTAEMPAVAVYNIGVSYKPLKKLLLGFDVQISGWKAYKTLDIEFLNPQLEPFNQHISKEYHNSVTLHLGGQYGLTDRLDLRAGLMLDCTPVNSLHYNPETPGMTKLEPSVGFSFRPLKNFSINASLLYVAGLGAKNRSCTYDDLLLKAQGKPYEKTFTADYHVHAWNPSIGVALSF